MTDDLATLATATGGVLSIADLRRWGCPRSMVDNAVRGGQLRSVCRGVYAVGPAPTTGQGRLRELSMGLGRLHGDRIALSHQSALVVHGLALLGVPLGRACAVQISGGVQSQPALQIWRPRQIPETERVDGLLVVRPEVAVVQVACAHGLRAGVVAGDSALHRSQLTRDQISDALHRLGATRGAGTARTVVQRLDPGSQSPGETILRLVAEDLGLLVQTQFPVCDHDGHVVGYSDLRVRGSRALLEFDGGIKYDGVHGRANLVNEKNREDRIRRLGWGLDRVVWRDFADIPSLARRIRSLVSRYPL